MSLTDEQLRDRQSCLTASEVPAVLGLSPFESALGVWLRKVGKAAPTPETDRMRWGHLLEPVIREDYGRRHGIEVRQVGTIIGGQAPHSPPVPATRMDLAATPDGLWPFEIQRRGLEIKTHSIGGADYGTPGTDEVPHHVAIQTHITGWLAGAERMDVVAFWDGQPHDYHVVVDATLCERIAEQLERWWVDHVVAHRMPTPDGSRSTQAALDRLYPGTHRPMKERTYLAPSSDTMRTLDQLRQARARLAVHKTEVAIFRQRLERTIGDADGFEWTEGGKKVRLHWTKARDGVEIDYRAALIDYQADLTLAVGADASTGFMRDRIRRGPDLARFTTTKPGSRRFQVPRGWKSASELVDDENDAGRRPEEGTDE